MPPASNAICPHCGQRAPLVLRGIDARCTVCGGKRLPFTGRTLNLAGRPSRWGGTAAKIVGWTITATGLCVALAIGLLLQTLFPSGYAGLAIGLPLGLLSLFFGLGLVLGGRKLSRQGDEAEREARLETIRALAAHQHGSVTAHDAARAMSLGVAEADALLTELAKQPDEHVSLEIDDDGGIHYLFGEEAVARRFETMGAYRFDAGSADAPDASAAAPHAEPFDSAEVRRQRR
jgi:hypothetical protein